MSRLGCLDPSSEGNTPDSNINDIFYIKFYASIRICIETGLEDDIREEPSIKTYFRRFWKSPLLCHRYEPSYLTNFINLPIVVCLKAYFRRFNLSAWIQGYRYDQTLGYNMFWAIYWFSYHLGNFILMRVSVPKNLMICLRASTMIYILTVQINFIL